MQKNNKIYKSVIAVLLLIIFVLAFILCFKSCSGKDDIIDSGATVTESRSETSIPEPTEEVSGSSPSQMVSADKSGTKKADESAPNSPEVSENLPSSTESNTNVANRSTAIPGYEVLNLKANRKQQNIALSNPSANNCYFKITLMLEDGTELWVSDLIKPGSVSDAICLSRELAQGEYNAVLKYNCYSLDGAMREMNGAQTKLSLRVN